MMNIIGIDYGSKLAGTTSLVVGNVLNQASVVIDLFRSKKSQDADRLVIEIISKFKPSKVFIDAPLSLPLVYSQLQSPNSQSDFFYRKADRLASAMSPLFLGGLTARAIRLKYMAMELDVEVYEVYPGLLSKHLGLTKYQYKKNDAQIASMISVVEKQFDISIDPSFIQSSHDFDAFLAFTTGVRFMNSLAVGLRDESEGMIWY